MRLCRTLACTFLHSVLALCRFGFRTVARRAELAFFPVCVDFAADGVLTAQPEEQVKLFTVSLFGLFWCSVSRAGAEHTAAHASFAC